jgi:hypothetical protein
MQCVDRDHSETPWSGEVHEHLSRSGCTAAARCDRHQALHNQHMDDVEAGLNQRYPGWNTPGSAPPPDFDPLYAGERWDEDD